MKLPSLQNCNTRKSNSFCAPLPLEATVDGVFKSPGAFFWLILHGLCCLISLVLIFRFSRLIFFLLFSTASHNSPSSMLRGTTENLILPLQTTPSSPPLLFNRTVSHVVVGRHGIRIWPWPHPNPTEVMRAHSLIERVQKEQREHPRPRRSKGSRRSSLNEINSPRPRTYRSDPLQTAGA